MTTDLINQAIARFNDGDLEDAVRVGKIIPHDQRADGAIAAALDAIGEAAIQRILGRDPVASDLEVSLADAVSLLELSRASVIWRDLALVRMNQTDAESALLAACFAFQTSPDDVIVRSVLAECAARADAPDVAAVLATTIVHQASGTPLGLRLQELVDGAEHTRLGQETASAHSITLKNEAEAWREISPARMVCGKIMALAGPAPFWGAAFDLAQYWGACGQIDLALALLDAIVQANASAGWAEQAHDEWLGRAGRNSEQYDRRIRVMSQEMTRLLPPVDRANAEFTVDADSTNAHISAIQSLEFHGFAIFRKLFDKSLIQQISQILFSHDPDRRFARPGHELSPDILEQLVPKLLREVVVSLGLVGPDYATSRARQIIPGIEVEQDLLTQSFHQDAIAFYQPLANLWIPLDPCGERAPGLALLSDRKRAIFPTRRSEQDVFENSCIRDDVIAQLLAEGPEIKPVMAPGDALLLLGSVPHRTHLLPTMTERRRSLELRFTLPSWLMKATAIT